MKLERNIELDFGFDFEAYLLDEDIISMSSPSSDEEDEVEDEVDVSRPSDMICC